MISYLLYRSASWLAGVLPRAASTRIAAAIAFLFFTFKPAIRRNVRTNFERLGLPDGLRCRVPQLLSGRNGSSEAVPPEPGGAREPVRGAGDREPRAGAEERAGGDPRRSAPRALGDRGRVYFEPRIRNAHDRARASVRARDALLQRHTKELELHGLSAAIVRRRAHEGARERRDVVLLVDRNFSHRGMRLRFLGGDVLLPDGHITLSLRSGAPLVPSCSYYTATGAIEIVIGEEIDTTALGGPRPRSATHASNASRSLCEGIRTSGSRSITSGRRRGMLDRFAAIVPAYNAAAHIEPVLAGIKGTSRRTRSSSSMTVPRTIPPGPRGVPVCR